MGIGTLFDIGLWAGCTTCALEAAAAYVRLARTSGGHKDPGSWHAPLIFTSGTVILLGILGVAGPLPAVVFAAFPLIAVGGIVSRAWREAAKVLGPRKATALVLAGLGRRVRDALWHSREDMRELAGALHRDGPVPATASGPAGAAPGPVINRARRVPSTAQVDLAVGPALVPEQVAAELEAAQVAIPSAWAAVAEWEASFEAEDEEDWRQHRAERAAGILTVAEVVGGQAEDLATGVKLDPAVITAETDFADDFADTASAAARSIQVYDSVYGSVHEHADNGGTLPEDARGWFGAGGPDGGQAA